MDEEDLEYDIKKPSELAKLNEFGCYEEPDGGVFIDDVYIAPPPPPALTFENDRPRLIITHIECNNFKSYGGTQVLGPFHKSFTSIVGPNGSGKSNVIDSMLFVFGNRAQKIRSKKLSDLIHNSSLHNNLQSCTVKVFFQEIIDQGENTTNSEGYEVVPNSQFVVSRTGLKDGGSYYEIDGKRRKVADVASLLKEKGIDLDHNRFLILQGEVEQIALMKPKGFNNNEVGMLEFLESIIGSDRFKEAIENLKVVHNQLDETRNEKLNRVKLVEKEKENLEKPKEEAMHLIHQLNSITRLKNQLFQLRIYLTEKAVEETQAKKIEFERSCSELMEKLKAITDEKAETENAEKKMTERLEKLTKNFESDKDLLKSHSLRHDKISDELKILNAKRKKAKQNKEQEEARFEKLEKVPEENKLKIDELTEHRTKLEAQYDEEKKKKDKALKELQAETQEFQDKKEQLETQLMSLQKNENDKQALYDVAKSELDLLKSTEMKEQVKLEQLQQKYDSATNELSEKEPKLDEHSEKIPALRSQTEKSKQELTKLNPEYDSLSKKVHDTRVKVDETRSKQSAERHGNRVLEALMRQKSIGALPGIYGRLGNLGAINQKYDVAISTAVGGGLDRILVDTLETATSCIKYLKDNDIGRADMLVLESTVHFASKVNCNFKAPGNAPRLIDLVEVNDPKLRTAFYHYMRDTLVADNLKQAREIAYGAKRFRVVTLDGEVIEISGAMSGGGGAKARGKMGTQVISQVNETEFKKMESTLVEAEEKLRVVSEKKAQEEHKIALCTREISERSRSFEKLKLEVARLKDESGLLKEQIEVQKKIVKESKPDLAKEKALGKKVEALLKDFEEATESSRDIREGVKEMNKKIQNIQNSKVKSISNKLNDVSSKLDKVKGEITRLQVGIRNSDRDLAKSKDNLETLSVEIKGLEKDMTEANQTREQIKIDAQELTEKNEKSEEEIIETKKELKLKRESLKKIEEKENGYKSEKIEFDQQLGNFKTEINKSKVAGKHWRRERGNLKFEDVPGLAPEDLELVDVPVEELENLDDGELQEDIDKLTEETKNKQLNLVVIEQYREKENLYMDRVVELEEATNLRDLKKRLLEDIKKKRQEEFFEGFTKITLKLKEMYQTITDGGDAELEYVDSLDPFAEGIVFSVRPPKKSWKNISNLSGGEKTLSSLALVFALHYYKPTPLYVMDEIDAALDFKNVSIVSHYIKERTKNAQFIIISLRANMFELADRLVGIYKTNDTTQSITINPNDVVPVARAS